jgi:hypothetical protein
MAISCSLPTAAIPLSWLLLPWTDREGSDHYEMPLTMPGLKHRFLSGCFSNLGWIESSFVEPYVK